MISYLIYRFITIYETLIHRNKDNRLCIHSKIEWMGHETNGTISSMFFRLSNFTLLFRYVHGQHVSDDA